MKKTLVVLLLLAGVVSNASATSVTYDYVGNLINRIPNIGTENIVGDNIRITAVFDNLIDNSNNTATMVTMTDGVTTITTDFNDSLIFKPDFYRNDGFGIENGSIVDWSLDFRQGQAIIDLLSEYSGFVSQGGAIFQNSFDTAYYIKVDFQNQSNDQNTIIDAKFNFNSPGKWTLREEQVSAVPVPAALPLMASALGLFGFARSRKQVI